MGEWITIGGILVQLLTAPGAPPSDQGRAPAAMPPSSSISGQIAAQDLCEGKGHVDGIESPYDDQGHTCYCTAVENLRGQTVGWRVSCY